MSADTDRMRARIAAQNSLLRVLLVELCHRDPSLEVNVRQQMANLERQMSENSSDDEFKAFTEAFGAEARALLSVLDNNDPETPGRPPFSVIPGGKNEG